MSVAVDFTASNGEISSPLSLHYRNPTGQLNQYETALMSVSSILVNYDSDQLIPAFGFGGIPGFLGSREVSHCFHLNGEENPQWQSVKGLMEAYQFSLANVSLSGPTYFAPFLKVFYDFAIENVSNPVYHIIMILTDGDIHDTTDNWVQPEVIDCMTETKNLIFEMSLLPISIVIIGVGTNEFELMEELDADKRALINSKGKAAWRDIVQFVKFSDYANKGYQLLSEEVLREIPDQVADYLTKWKVKL